MKSLNERMDDLVNVYRLFKIAGEGPSGGEILRAVFALGEMLLEKNAAYGDSALNPLRVFSRADAAEQIRVRIDDKLSRLARGSDAGEDVIGDLLGYLVLLVVQMRRDAQVPDRDRPSHDGALRDRGPDGAGSARAPGEESPADADQTGNELAGGGGGAGRPLSFSKLMDFVMMGLAQQIGAKPDEPEEHDGVPWAASKLDGEELQVVVRGEDGGAYWVDLAQMYARFGAPRRAVVPAESLHPESPEPDKAAGEIGASEKIDLRLAPAPRPEPPTFVGGMGRTERARSMDERLAAAHKARTASVKPPTPGKCQECSSDCDLENVVCNDCYDRHGFRRLPEMPSEGTSEPPTLNGARPTGV